MESPLPIGHYLWEASPRAVGISSALLHRRARVSWSVLLVAMYAFICWMLLFAHMRWWDGLMMEWINSIPNPTDEQLHIFSTDGASKAFLLFFGYAVCAVFVTICWIAVRAVTQVLVFVSRKIARS